MKLHHHDLARPLYIEADASKEWGFGIFVYHVIDDPDPVLEPIPPPAGFEGVENGPTTWLKRVKDFPNGSIQPILFMSKRLSSAEENYFPTELEMSAVVWVATKLRHMIAASRMTYIFTDHSAVTAIAQQRLLSSTSSEKLNLRLIRCAQYLQQFINLKVLYRPGRTHYVPDCLSRLQGIATTKDTSTDVLNDLEYQYTVSAGTFEAPLEHCKFVYHEDIQRWKVETWRGTHPRGDTVATADILPPQPTRQAHPPAPPAWPRPAKKSGPDIGDFGYAFHATLVALSDDFKNRLRNAYESEPHWQRILAMLKGAASDDLDALNSTNHLRGINFVTREDLLYFVDPITQAEKLCIPSSMQQEVFEMAHDRHLHQGYHRAYERIQSSMFIRKLAKNLRKYIRYCPACLENRTERHQPYGSLEPIQPPGHPFYTITIDLVTGLPASTKGRDALMTVTCKRTKRVLLIPGMTDWSAAEWGAALIEALITHEWGLPKALISDRDKRFLNELWHAMFHMTGISFLTSTAWHPQTDGQSERTNQTVEIALRYYCTANPDADWEMALPYVQFSLNTAISAATGVSPNQQLMGFNPRDTLSALADLPEADFQALRQQYRDMATEALAFAAVNMKFQYDKKHKPLNLKKGDWVMLRLHHGYRVQGHLNRKLDMQRSSPVRVIGKVGKNAYKLDLPGHMRIHNVVSVSQLEPLPEGEDPFGRTFEARQGPIEAADDDDPPYEIERLLARRLDKRTGARKYLVQWKGWGSIHNVWYDEADLSGARELVQEYDTTHPETLEEAEIKNKLRKDKRTKRTRRQQAQGQAAPDGEKSAQQSNTEPHDAVDTKPAPNARNDNVTAPDTGTPVTRTMARVEIPARRRRF